MTTKELYTAKEYFALFDNMHRILKHMEEEKQALKNQLTTKVETLIDELKSEKEKRSILEKRLIQATEEFLELTKK